ncbi:hypothetical protein F5880DRAFT_825269 [Lentinula raphanica]|nr:hypothetical protein F5880DRAFT_825269 [Lentinula raphanica]
MLRFLFSTFFSTFFLVAHADGIVDCLGTELDWYKTKVGETPCTTYERLRKICNPSFQTDIMHTNAPPDTCMDEFGDYCCNSVAFALSMFCLACQQGKGINITGAESPRITSGVTSSKTAITVSGSTFPTVVSETPSISSGSTSGSSGSHLSKGAIGGIAAASTIVSICAALLVLWYFCSREKTKREDARLIASRNIRPYLESAEVAGPLLAGEIVTPIPTRRPRKPERDSPMPGHQTRRPQPTLDNLDRQSNSISSQPDITSDPVIFSPLRHTDAGPVVEDRMSENSRSLPPAYGDQVQV